MIDDDDTPPDDLTDEEVADEFGDIREDRDRWPTHETDDPAASFPP